jgi:hypothetical protein
MSDPWLDSLLHAPHVDDDGFVDRVAVALPAAHKPHRDRNPIVAASWLLSIATLVIVGVANVDAPHALLSGIVVDGGVRLQGAAVLLLAAPLGLVWWAIRSGERLRVRLPLLATTASTSTSMTLPELTASTAALPALAIAPHARVTRVDDLDDDDRERLGRLVGGANPAVGKRLLLSMAALGMVAGVLAAIIEDGDLTVLSGALAAAFVVAVLVGLRRLAIRDAAAVLVDDGFDAVFARDLADTAVRMRYRSLRDLWDASVKWRQVPYLRSVGQRIVDSYAARAAQQALPSQAAAQIASKAAGAKPRR